MCVFYLYVMYIYIYIFDVKIKKIKKIIELLLMNCESLEQSSNCERYLVRLLRTAICFN